jgi:hypothetical protein
MTVSTDSDVVILTVRLSAEQVRLLDAEQARLRKSRPGSRTTRSDVVREMIVALGKKNGSR